MDRRGAARAWKHLETLMNGEGDITIGRVGPIRCVATASDGYNTLAMLVRRGAESLEQLLMRLDDAVRQAVEEEIVTDEINP